MAVKELRERIKSVKSTRQITGAMKMVAAAKLMKTQRMALASRPYVQELERLVASLATGCGEQELPLLCSWDAPRIAVLLMTGNRGLAGGFNTALINRALAVAGEHPDCEVDYIAIGRKGCDFLKRGGHCVVDSYLEQDDRPSPDGIGRLSSRLADSYARGRYRQVIMVYQSFLSAGQQEVTASRLLPLSLPTSGATVEYICAEGIDTLMPNLLARYLHNRVYQSLLETRAAEHLARMTAMTAAGSNADEMLHTLALCYNRTRQAAITREIAEVMGGAAANKQQEACNVNR